MKNILRKSFNLNNPGSGEKEFFRIPDYVENFIVDKRNNNVYGEQRPVVNFTFLYNPQNPRYQRGQYLAVRSYKQKQDYLLDKGYAFGGIVNYGDNRTETIFVYCKIVQLN